MASFRKILIIVSLLILLLLLSAYAGFLGPYEQPVRKHRNKESFQSNGNGMTVLFPDYDPAAELKMARSLTDSFDAPVIFHCYWDGELNEKHLVSLKSCYYFNVLGKTYGSSIILWMPKIGSGAVYDEASKYCEIRVFDFNAEAEGTVMAGHDYSHVNTNPSFFSDVVRYTLLYKYGGCWFDLDVFFLRSLDPIFSRYTDEIIVYQWDNQNHPNGAVFISLNPESERLKSDILYIAERNRGWGFQEAGLTFDLPMDYLVLPCSWFDPWWRTDNPYDGAHFNDFFKKTNETYTFESFCEGAFTFHWHNQWGKEIEPESPFAQLSAIMDAGLAAGAVRAIST